MADLINIEMEIINTLKVEPIRDKERKNKTKILAYYISELKPFFVGFNLNYFLNIFKFQDMPIKNLTEYKSILLCLNRVLRNNLKLRYVNNEKFYFFE